MGKSQTQGQIQLLKCGLFQDGVRLRGNRLDDRLNRETLRAASENLRGCFKKTGMFSRWLSRRFLLSTKLIQFLSNTLQSLPEDNQPLRQGQLVVVQFRNFWQRRKGHGLKF